MRLSRIMRVRSAVCVTLLSLVTAAFARGETAGAIHLSDLQGTDGRWQSGETTVAAPAAQVQAWFGEAAAWPSRFPDVEWAKVISTEPDGTRVVQFKSSILGRTMTLHVREQAGLIAYTGEGSGVSTQGKILIQPAGEGRTHVVLQTTADLHGAVRLVVTEGAKRARARRKLGSDLASIIRLSKN